MFDLEFTPLNDNDLNILEKEEREKRLLAEGTARWEIITSAKKMSQSGNPMIEVNFKVWDCEGKSGFVKDFFVVGENSFFLKKIKTFCESGGIEEVYKTGKIKDSDFHPGMTGDCILIRKLYKEELQNNIKEYIKKEQQNTNTNNILNDSLDDTAF
jgi:hypothetical protein